MIEAEDALSQSTRFKDRVFLSAKKERASVLQLVNGETDMLSFLSSEITSHNGSLLRSLVEYIEDNYSHLPEEYSRMIKNICKPSFLAIYHPLVIEKLDTIIGELPLVHDR